MAGARRTLYLALALLAAAALFALPSLYVPAIALALLAGGSIAWVEAAARGLRVGYRPGPTTVEEGDSYPLRLRVRWGRPPPPGGEISHPGLRRPLAIGPGAPGNVAAELRFARWGPRELEPPVLSIHDPLRLHQRQVAGGAGRKLLVLPRVEPLTAPANGDGGDPAVGRRTLGTGAGGRAAPAFDPEIDGLRPWRPGTPASRIHWPSVARAGELLERNLVGGADSSPLVVLDRSQPADDEALVKAVRAAASLCLHLGRAGGCSLLLPGESRALAIDPELRSWPRVHARLAMIDPERPGPVYPPPEARTIFWVAPAGGLGGRGARPGGWGDGYLVTPSALPDARPAFEVAGCRGYRLGAIARAPMATGGPRRRPRGEPR
jgi:uncharacterized protein (DUF58 family)